MIRNITRFIIFTPKKFLALLLLSGSISVSGQITQVGNVTTAYSENVQSFSINKPAGVQVGDIMILNIVKYLDNNTNNPWVNDDAGGWTTIDSRGLSGSNFHRGTIMYKVVTVDWEPSSYTIVPTNWWPNVTYAAASIVAYRGVNVSNPFDAIPGTITTTSGVNGNTVNPPGITTVTPNALVMMLGMNCRSDNNASHSFSNWTSASPVLTEIYDYQGANRLSVGAAAGIKTTAGATGNGTITLSGNNAYRGGIVLALRPQPIITTGTVSGSPFYAGSSVSVPFTITGSYNSGNIFTAQLSDASGNFGSPVNIGTLASTTSGVIAAVIPANAATGTGYRIRVVSSDPAVTGSDNGTDLIVNEAPIILSSANPAVRAANVSPGATRVPIYKAVITVTGNQGVNFSNLTFTPTGTFVSSDISYASWSSGLIVWTNTTDDLATATQYSNSYLPSSDSPLSMAINTPWFDSGSTHYVWITADISPNAVPGHTLTVGALTTADFTFTGGTKTGTMYAGGTQTITDPSQPTVTTGTVSGSPFCTGSSVSVPFTITRSCNSGNIFTAQLSDASGNFGSPVNIGTLASTTSGAIAAVIPASAAAGTGYRIRVLSSNPEVTGSDNGTDLTVNEAPAAPATTGTMICIGSTATLSANGAVSGQVYKWYNEATGGKLLKTSTDNTDNTYTTLALTATTNYWVAVQDAGGAESPRTQVTAVYPSKPASSQTTSGTDTWIGHIYDGINIKVPYDGNFTNYYGTSTQQETFDENFGGNENCYGFHSDNRSIYTETFSIRYRMTSTRKGLYVVNLGSDDGGRLAVDGDLVYNSWTYQSFSTRYRVLMSLNGNSSLVYDFFENGGVNRVIFTDLTLILENKLTANTTQTIELGNMGDIISGDSFGTLPEGISLSGTGYQWTYSTTPDGTRIDIPDATGATYTPNATTAPFNVPGTYYLYRNAILSSTNNVSPSPSPYTAVNESNGCTITIEGLNFWVGGTSTAWNIPANWSSGSIPASGEDVEFATTANYGAAAVSDLYLDQDRTIGNLINRTDKKLVIPVGKSLTVNGNIDTDNNNRILIKAPDPVDTEPKEPNGSLVFRQTTPVYGTVEMYSRAWIDATKESVNDKCKWQYFGIPVESVAASPTFSGAYVRIYDETKQTAEEGKQWTSLSNGDAMEAFKGYEITQDAPAKYSVGGQLVNRNFSKILSVSSGSYWCGQHVLANPYTAAVEVSALTFGTGLEQTIYIYHTGSFNEWKTGAGQGGTVFDENAGPGQYLAIPKEQAEYMGMSIIPSMQGFLVKVKEAANPVRYSDEERTFSINYPAAATKNSTYQRAVTDKSQKVFTAVTLKSENYSDKLWLFTESHCTPAFDNSWDGPKVLVSGDVAQLYVIGSDNNYQVSSLDDIDGTYLGIKAGSADTGYMLHFDNTNLSERYGALYLHDLETGAVTDIFADTVSYRFTAKNTAEPGKRFKIIARAVNDNENGNGNNLHVFAEEKTIYINNGSDKIGQISMYDLSGRLTLTRHFAASSVSAIRVSVPAGMYIVNCTSEDNVTTSMKIIIR